MQAPKQIISVEIASRNMGAGGAEDSRANEAMFQKKSHAPDRTALHSFAPEYTVQIVSNKMEINVTTVALMNAGPPPEQEVSEKVLSEITPDLLSSRYARSSIQSENKLFEKLNNANPATNTQELLSFDENKKSKFCNLIRLNRNYFPLLFKNRSI